MDTTLGPTETLREGLNRSVPRRKLVVNRTLGIIRQRPSAFGEYRQVRVLLVKMLQGVPNRFDTAVHGLRDPAGHL